MQGKALYTMLPYGSVWKAHRRPTFKWVVALLAALTVILLLWSYIYCAALVVYNYAWWVLFSGSVLVAQPQTVTSTTPEVPKILHQTWLNETIPDKWKAASQACKDLHPGYQHILWTDAKAEDLIATKFPWFTHTYRSYPHAIQRADALRYFVLYEYGGIYLDLDIHCLKSLDFLRFFNFTAPKTYPIGLSNDIIVSRPKDPFAFQLIHSLKTWDHWFFLKYATVMFSTGPMFVTVQYTVHPHKDQVRMLPKELYGKYGSHPDALMKHLHGSSWHGGDAKLVFWFEAYWTHLLVLGGLAILGLAAWLHLHYVHKRGGPRSFASSPDGKSRGAEHLAV